MRLIWTLAGFCCVALGMIGAVLPLLPTVPFMLLGAFCFARGSERFHRWLIEHPRFGPAIVHWQRHGAISRRGKRAAGLAIGATFLVSLLVGVPSHVLVIQAIVLTGVIVFLFTRPDGPAA